jgi:ketosteroid isomerase-like protein
MAGKRRQDSQDEADIRVLIERWAEAVRRHDRTGILADHDSDIVMFDVPPPLQLRGMEEYSGSWDLFFGWHRPSDAFDVRALDIVAGGDVAFAVALMRCGGADKTGAHSELDFRLTVGLRKIDGRWRVIHEHHSVPAE